MLIDLGYGMELDRLQSGFTGTNKELIRHSNAQRGRLRELAAMSQLCLQLNELYNQYKQLLIQAPRRRQDDQLRRELLKFQGQWRQGEYEVRRYIQQFEKQGTFS